MSAAVPRQRTTLESEARNTRQFRGDAASHCCTTLFTQHTTALHAATAHKLGREGSPEGLSGARRGSGCLLVL